MNKKCLIVDNEDQSEEIEKLIRDSRNRGITLECEQFNIGDPAYSEVLTQGRIDIYKVIIEYRKRFGGKTFHLVAFDWQLEDEIDGVELIRQLKYHRIFRNTPKIVYSGLMDDILKTIIKDNSTDNTVKKIKAIVKNGVIDYLERDDRDNEIINFFLSHRESVDNIIEAELKKFPELVFDNSFISKNFNGKSYKELAELLSEDDVVRNKFSKEIIQQVVSYLTVKI